MRVQPRDPPRPFRTGKAGAITLSDCGAIRLAPDELVTFLTESGAEYDVVRKDWGFYATPSTNARLRDRGLRAVLVQNAQGRVFIWLVERGQEARFEDYLGREEHRVLAWLDSDQAAADAARRLTGSAGAIEEAAPGLLCLCGGAEFVGLFSYERPPKGESRFSFSDGPGYRREVLRCARCGHCRNVHALDLSELYSGAYVDGTYGDDQGLARAFERISALPPEKSDNVARATCVDAWGRAFLCKPAGADPAPDILDVGSGLGVFVHRMKEHGWRCTALDPDERAARHARERLGVAAIHADFMRADTLPPHSAVSFNKVLEHVLDPVAMLARAHACLKTGGFVYLELPDAEAAGAGCKDEGGFGFTTKARRHEELHGEAPSLHHSSLINHHSPSPPTPGAEREEFFIDHHHVFSLASLCILADRAGFRVVQAQRLHEPSGKFTLRAFLTRLEPERPTR